MRRSRPPAAISISDADADDTPDVSRDVASTVGDNGYGSFVLSSGTWTYTLDQSAVQDLDAGDVVSDTITFTASGWLDPADHGLHHRYR